MNFEKALGLLKQGNRLSRMDWNGKGMFLFLVQGSTSVANREPLVSIFGEGTEVKYQPHISMRTATGSIVPWLASQVVL